MSAHCAHYYYYGSTYYGRYADSYLLTTYYGRYADFYERALLNGIVGNQDRRDPTKGTSYIYMLPLGGAVKKASCLTPLTPPPSLTPHSSAPPPLIPATPLRAPPSPHPSSQAWGKSDFGFPCCWGTLSESFAKLSDSIFFAAADGSAVYVNQYVSAAVHLAYGVRLVQVRPLTSSRACVVVVLVRSDDPVG